VTQLRKAMLEELQRRNMSAITTRICTQRQPPIGRAGLLPGFEGPVRFHEVSENVVDARQVTFPL
jgi:hypothetical protein